MTAVFRRAAAMLAQVADYGRPLWVANGCRAYERRDGDAYELRLVAPGRTDLVYALVGVDGESLR